jgi:2'-5' RNA ligase
MRLFVGIPVATAVAVAAGDLVELLRSKAARLAPKSRLTWVSGERLHVTVRFIGHVADAKAAGIVEALRPPLGLDPFDLTVTGVGVFPPKGAPRVIWAGLSFGRDRLGAIEQIVSDRLAAAGVARESRPFNPHLTLARVRDADGLRAQTLLDGLGATSFGSTPVDAITLFESRLSPRGPAYLVIQRTPLT